MFGLSANRLFDKRERSGLLSAGYDCYWFLARILLQLLSSVGVRNVGKHTRTLFFAPRFGFTTRGVWLRGSTSLSDRERLASVFVRVSDIGIAPEVGVYSSVHTITCPWPRTVKEQF